MLSGKLYVICWLFIDNACVPRGDEERCRIPREAREHSVDVLIAIEVGANWIDFRRPGHHPLPLSIIDSRDSPDEPRTELNGSDVLDCREARIGQNFGLTHNLLVRPERGL